MKRCRKPPEGPACLEDFRKANPTATWDEFRNHNGGDNYASLRAELADGQGNLCAYCENRLREENRQVAHFHPKSDSSEETNWALDWQNLWLACKGGTQSWMKGDPAEYLPPLPENRSCDEAKEDRVLDGIILAPNEIPTFPRIFRYKQDLNAITILPDEDRCREARIPVEKVQKTIDAFNLNCYRLSVARLELHREIERMVKRFREKSVDPKRLYTHLAERFLSRGPDGSWNRFFTFLRWRFGRIAEEYLETNGFEG